MWNLVGKLFGQDLTKISLPVILSEPISSLQKACENLNIQEDLAAKAAVEPDSLKRMGMTIGHCVSQMDIGKTRTKKFFNPMLGETYELVTEDFRFISEQVSHHPPISAYYQEGRNYTIHGFLDAKSSFGFGGGKGVMIIKTLGYTDYYFENFEETISIGRPTVYAQNIVIGTLYLDYEGECKVFNHKTGEKAVITYFPQGWNTPSRIEGKMWSASGELVYNIVGSWVDALYIEHVATREKICIYQALPFYENHKRMFGFN